MSLLLLFGGGGGAPPIDNLEALISAAPEAGQGYPVQLSAVSGEWRFAVELSDPTAEGIVWHDLTAFYAGDRYQRGGDQPWGRFAASVAQVQLQLDALQAEALGVDINILAPWGQDTTDLFGVDVTLDAGLLMRAGIFNVIDGDVATWYPLWTGRVESWGDDSNARGQIRRHVVNVVDLLSDLANVPTIVELNTDNWADYFTQYVLGGAGWAFGVDIYGDTTSTGILQDLTPTAAIVRMDQGADPLGLAWRTRRNGKMIIYPAPWDTTNTARWTSNPLLAVYPDGLMFKYEPDFTDVEYIADDDVQPFGVSRSIAGVLNTFAVTFTNADPDELYLADDPVSQGRFGWRPYTASWITDSSGAVEDLLTARAYASSQALPLATTIDHEGFFPAAALIDHLDPVTVVHATLDGESTVTVVGVVRNIVEERSVRFGLGGDVAAINWQTTVQLDINSTESSPALLPVEDLALVSTFTPQFGGPSAAEFSWTNPTQPDITPTNVQVRIPGRSLIWTDIDYPGTGADGVSVNWLAAATGYTFQVRLIRRVNGIVTAVSPRREISFTTPAVIPPHIVPGDDPTDWDVDGNLPDACPNPSIELQEATTPTANDWTTIDEYTGTELEIDDQGNYDLAVQPPLSLFDEDKVYRLVLLCDGEIEVVGPTQDPPDSWDDPCTTPPGLGLTPFDDAILYVPQICAPDIIREAVSGIQAVPGDALAGFGVLDDDPNYRTLVSIGDADSPAWSDTAGIVAYGQAPQIVGVVHDKSVMCRVVVNNAETCLLFETAAMRITCTEVSGLWRPGVTVYKVGSTISLAGASLLDEGTAYYITATHDYETGDIKLYVNGILDNSVGGTDNVATVHALPIWSVGAPPGSWITDCALWDRVLAAGELPSPPVLMNAVHWWDFNEASTTASFCEDLIGSADLSNVGLLDLGTTLGTEGLQSCRADPSGAATERMTTSALALTSQPIWASWVCKVATVGSVFFELGSRPPFHCAAGSNGSQWGMQSATGGGSATGMDGGTYDTAGHVFYAEWNGASSKLYVDGTLVVSGNIGTNGANNVFTLFNKDGGGNGGDMTFGELLLGTGTNTSGAITAEYNRLSTKWGV